MHNEIGPHKHHLQPDEVELVDSDKHPGALNTEAADQLPNVVRTYWK